jgi:hypothetical protein
MGDGDRLWVMGIGATSQNNWCGNLTLMQLTNFSCEIPLHPALMGISQEKFIQL